MSVERRPVHHGVAGSAVPGGVAAAVAEAGDVSDKDLVRGPERVPARAVARLGLVLHGPDELALVHNNESSASE